MESDDEGEILTIRIKKNTRTTKIFTTKFYIISIIFLILLILFYKTMVKNQPISYLNQSK